MFELDFFKKTIKAGFFLIFFLVPLVLTPVNYELFEFNKMVLTYFLTAIIIAAWIGKIIVSKKIKFKKTPLDIPILIFLLSSLASTIFSIDTHTSLWGYYSRFHGGLMSTTCYILLFYAFVNNIKKKDVSKFIYVFLTSAFLVAFYGILEHFGIDDQYWIQDVKNRVFSTLGQPNWLGAFINGLIFIPLSLSLTVKLKPKASLYYLIYAVFFFCLIFTSSKSAILAFWSGFLLFSALFYYLDKKVLKKLGVLWLTTIIIYLALGQGTLSYVKKAPLWLNVFSQKPVATQAPPIIEKGLPKPFISESSSIRKVVWKGAIDIFKAYPLFGSGLETYGYAYYNFRPQEHNLLSEWDFLYNKAHNEFLNILATQGAFGLLSYLFLIFSFLFWAFKKIVTKKSIKDESHYQIKSLLIAFISGYLTILVTNFFGFSVVIIGILFFLIPAFSFTLTSSLVSKTIKLKFLTNKHYQNFLLILVFLLTFYSLFNILGKWRADFHFSKAQKYASSSYILSALPELQKAISLNPNEALYHSQLSESAAKLALAYSQADASDSAKLIDELIKLTIQEAEITLILNQVHLNFYKSTAKSYIYLSMIDDKYKADAVSILQKASKLAPTDAKILYNLGLLSYQQEDYANATDYWEQSIKLKPNYIKVYLELADLYIETDNDQKAVELLKYLLENVDPVNTKAKQVLETIKE
ncbi:O-antigen ligase family protein [Patescibacteria group bacterium]